jgi:hypothetical protein
MNPKKAVTLVFAAATLAALGMTTVRCKDSNTITGGRAAPTPTAPPASIAGAWSGTFNSFDLSSCDWNVPAHATFEQQGSTVDGTLGVSASEYGCGPASVVIHATLVGGSLEGTTESSSGRYRIPVGSHVTGTLSGGELDIVLHTQYISGGTMQLHR